MVSAKLLLAALPLVAAFPSPQPVTVDERSLLGNLLGSVETLLSQLGVTLYQLGYKHGYTWNMKQNFTAPAVTLSAVRYAHSITFPPSNQWIDWTTYKGNGVNIGAWLEQEQAQDTYFWNMHAPNAPDEWTFCQTLGSQCGPVLEQRYATYITTADIDKVAAAGVNILRIPTTYAAWVKVPGSQFYSGNQQKYLKTITDYAISRYNMHIIVGLHSLPGGVNSLDIGEAFGHDGWFQNSTNLDYSLQATQAIVNFVQNSGYMQHFTIAPINEASDNFAGFATATGLTTNGTNWIVTYINAVIAQVAKVDKRIPVMLQDCFLGETYWSPLFPAGTNLVIDSHVYYFAASGIYGQYVTPAICGQAQFTAGDGKFPVFVGEFSLQTLYNNTFANRKTIYDTQKYAWSKYMAGGAFWEIKLNNTAAVDGEGTQPNYWSFEGLIDAGVVTSTLNSSYC